MTALYCGSQKCRLKFTLTDPALPLFTSVLVYTDADTPCATGGQGWLTPVSETDSQEV